MAPTALLNSAGTAQSFCPAISSKERWQPKRAIPFGTSPYQPPSHINTRMASLKSFLSLKPRNCLSGRSRRSGFGSYGKGPCSSGHVLVASVKGSIAVEETPSESFEREEGLEAKAAEPAASLPAPRGKARSKERFQARVPGQKTKREDPLVPNEALVAGAQFTGTVTTIQPFGAFVNFGASTDGLVHISKLSTGYVNNVRDFVTIGQEVKVTILNVEHTSGRIALSMVDKEEQQAKEAATRTGEAKEGGEERPRLQQGPDGRPLNRGRVSGRQSNTKRGEPKKPPTKLVKGLEVEGIVKNRIRSGLFVELAENEEGFLRFSDIPGGDNMAPEASLQSGEKIKATVLKIDRGKISLTMKPNLDITSVNRDINKDNDGSATNPFEIAFRALNFIPKKAALPEGIVEINSVSEKPPCVEEEASGPQATATATATGEGWVDLAANEYPVPEAAALATEKVSPAEKGVVLEALASPEEVVAEATTITVEEETGTEMAAEGGASETLPVEEVASVPEEKADAGIVPEVTAAAETVEGIEKVISEATASVDEILSAEGDISPKAEAAKDQSPKPVKGVTAVVEETPPVTEEVVSESIPEFAAAVEKASVMEEAVLKTMSKESSTVKEALPQPISGILAAVEEASPAEDVTAAVKSAPEEASAAAEEITPDVPSAEDLIAACESTIEDASPVAKEVFPDAPATEDVIAAGKSAVENGTVVVDEVVPDGPASPELISTVQSETGVAGPEPSAALQVEKEVPVDTKPATGISAASVKQLRDETGAGMMDCKRALVDAGGDIKKARGSLRKKGLASADKKASRVAAEGLIGSYVHDSRVGVLVEVNCETDFVSRGSAFKSLVQDVGMQVVASQGVQFVSVDDIPLEYVSKEKEMEAQRDNLVSKPEAIRAKIVEGRLSKKLKEIALLEQPYIRDDKVLVRDLVKETVAVLGENIKIRRFERYVLGEGLQKKSTDFAADVAAQAAVKDPVEASKAAEAGSPGASAPELTSTVAVSTSLVKELRYQTGAGMMECKKALKATENDFEKAVDFLRKIGLASADRKARRLASEGLVGSYIHDGRIGILIEVNCETDFVARGDKFRGLVRDLAMQAAASPLVQFVNVSDVPVEVVAKEKEMEMAKEDLASKPEAIRRKIVDGRVAKRMSELALLEQPFIKDDKKLMKDVVKETVAALGENIQVRRFTRFTLGEGIEKKVADFASEVAAQAGLKA